MNIGIIDNEFVTRSRHNFPNLALMKLSSHHKLKGDEVMLTNFDLISSNNLFKEEYDTIYVSRVFSDTYTPDFIFKMSNVITGGSGFKYDKAESLNNDIEHCKPDYDLYKGIGKGQYYENFSIGFTTRGCIRQCPFCINVNSKKVYKHSPVNEFLDESKPFIMLLDDNITAYSGFFDVFDMLNNIGKPFVYKQGMDFRLLTEKKMKTLWASNYYSTSKKTGGQNKGGRVFHFAFDDINDYDLIEKRLKQYYYLKPYAFVVQFYVLCGFDRDDKYDESFFKFDIESILRRIDLLFRYNAQPYIMIHENVKYSPYADLIYDLRNTFNNIMNYAHGIEYALDRFKKTKLRDYIYKNHKWFLKTKHETRLYRNLNDFEKNREGRKKEIRQLRTDLY